MNSRHITRVLSIVTAAVLCAGTQRLPAEDMTTDDVTELAARIDGHIAAAWKVENIEPAPLADDAEFLRRTYLNLAGTIPPVIEVREFLENDDPDKRRQLVERLLNHPGFVNHQAHSWRLLMIPEAELDDQARILTPGFEIWLRDKLIDDTPYDQMVREMITCQISGNDREGPVVFFRAKDVKPGNVASSVSRLFLGIQLDCAQCHDHPFSEWKREEFWGFTAFFAGIEGDQLGSISDDPSRREIKIPDTEKIVSARFIDRTTPEWKDRDNSRTVLADWITREDNPYFARTSANRIWAHLFGTGLVDPPDGFDASNPPSHPDLLADLGEAFASHDYDVKFLIRAITTSKTYQRSSRQTHPSQNDPRWYGRMSLKGLSPRQLTDSLMQATGAYQQSNLQNLAFNNGFIDAQIASVFENSTDSAIDPQSTILQALAMMNGQFVTQQTEPSSSRTLSAVIQAPFLDTDGKIETLYLATLSRRPTNEELVRLRLFVASKADSKPGFMQKLVQGVQSFGQPVSTSSTGTGQEQGLADVFWALLNSSEFLFNH